MRWVVGDVHGMAKSLEGLVKLVEQHDRDTTFYFVGDFVNRGPDSRVVVDFLLQMTNARCIRGNHDNAFDAVVNAHRFETPGNGLIGEHARGDEFQVFCRHGLVQTLLSYGATETAIGKCRAKYKPERLNELVASVPEAHRAFFRQLPGSIVDDDAFVTHASWPIDRSTRDPEPDLALEQDEKLRMHCLWHRFSLEELQSDKAWGRRGYFGHTPTVYYLELLRGRSPYSPVMGADAVLLDTAATLTPEGRLTAVSIEEGRVLQVDVDGAPVE